MKTTRFFDMLTPVVCHTQMSERESWTGQRIPRLGNQFVSGRKSALPVGLPGLFFMIVILAIIPHTEARADQAYGYLLPASSYSYIDQDTVYDWPLQVINYAKNEIYARNGRMFVSDELQNWFNQQYWYTPIYTADQFLPSMLNVYETANVTMLSNLEDSMGTYQLDQPGYSYSILYQYLSTSYGTSDQYYVNPNTYIFYYSNKQYLTSSDVSMLSLQELCYARNEIYARHGYIFVSTELNDYFNAKNWYMGTIDASEFSDSVFNIYETTNISLLLQTELSISPGGYVLDQPGYSYSSIGNYSSGVTTRSSSSDFIFYDSAIRYLTDAEVSSLTLQMLNYAKNEIYARRGYIFQSQELRDYFGSKSWYYPTVPAASFSDSVFNEYEVANVALLQEYEYAINPNGYQLY